MKSKATPSIPLVMACIMLVVALSCGAHAQTIAKSSDSAFVGAGRGLVNPPQDKTAPDRALASGSAIPDPEKTNPTMLGHPPKLTPVAAMPPSKAPINTDSAINPLTGKSFSEERLTRLLNANKLLTDIYRQQVSQAQLQTELELTGDRRQAESAKLRSEAINIIPKPTVPTKESLKPGEELMSSGRSQRPPVTVSPKTESTQSMAMAVPQAIPAPASGTLKIGSETFQAQSTYSGPQSKIVYVDAQPTVQRNTPVSVSNMPGPTPMSSAGAQFPQNFIPSPIPR